MSLPMVACVVCARPLDALLTSGLQAGVAVLALVAVVVVAGLVRGAVAVVRHDRLQQAGAASRASVETP
ncbi:MAG: hypothetical protein R2745_21745 [Vicinamibacterales bacterium]